MSILHSHRGRLRKINWIAIAALSSSSHPQSRPSAAVLITIIIRIRKRLRIAYRYVVQNDREFVLRKHRFLNIRVIFKWLITLYTSKHTHIAQIKINAGSSRSRFVWSWRRVDRARRRENNKYNIIMIMII